MTRHKLEYRDMKAIETAGSWSLHELRIQWFIAHATKALYDMMIQRQVIEG